MLPKVVECVRSYELWLHSSFIFTGILHTPNMLPFPISVLFACIVSAMFFSGTALEDQDIGRKISANVNASCTPYQTECALGCCPYQDAVCCADGFECCQHGQTCIPVIGICIGLNEEDGKLGLISSKTTSLENLITACPPGMTPCGKDKCCRFPHGTCCSDGTHCCPQGYRCDVPHKRCIRDSLNELGLKWGIKPALAEVPALKMALKSPYKSCPGSGRVCPSYSSCCIQDNGEWGCCPNPSFPQMSYVNGECCDTIFGHMCCPDDYPTCTPIGCMK